jgi:hypothetical protein
MKYVHFRDNQKRLRATLAYYAPDPNDPTTLVYGVSIVSESELNKASKKDGRIKSGSKAIAAEEHKGVKPFAPYAQAEDFYMNDVVSLFHDEALFHYGWENGDNLRRIVLRLKDEVDRLW